MPSRASRDTSRQKTAAMRPQVELFPRCLFWRLNLSYLYWRESAISLLWVRQHGGDDLQEGLKEGSDTDTLYEFSNGIIFIL